MELSRRSFLKAAGLTLGLSMARLGLDMPAVQAAAKEFKLKNCQEFTSVCHFCACGCGVIGYVRDGKLIQLEGAVDSPVNRGSLCSKGLGYAQIPNAENRLKKPLYRAPYSDKWQEISWEEAIDKAAHALYKAREENFIRTEVIDGQEVTVNRTDAISFIGGSQVNNEECWQLIKMTRGMGAIFTDNQTRVCHATTPPALNAAFGRGAMTNPWYDLKHAKLVWIEGANTAECHPMGFKNIMNAKKENGAKIVHVDVRFTRTSKVADKFLQLRPGTDIAFLGACIKYIMENNLVDHDYLRRNTNAYCLLRPDYKLENGIFSGYNEKERHYDKASWGYQVDAAGKPLKSDDLNAPNTVFTVTKEHFSRYTPEVASKITGIAPEDIIESAKMMATIKPLVFMYALGLTQHTVGVENIRCYTLITLLTGNVGIPGGGICAMRGQPNVQASTDFGIMYQYFPGYLSYPTEKTNTLAKWTKENGTFRAKFLKNMLKSWFGDMATPENDFCFNLLPIRNSHNNDSMYGAFDRGQNGGIKCMYVTGQNPQMTNANLEHVNRCLRNMDTLIYQDLFLNETGAFWQRPGDDPSKIKTEVIVLPACSYLEKEGTLTNSMRMIQWRMKGPDCVGESKPDYEICDMLWRRFRELYKDSTDPKDLPIKNMVWNYPKEHMVEHIMKEINGYDLTTGQLLNGIGEIKDDGTTNSGMWIYAGVYGGGIHHAKLRGQDDPGNRGIFAGYAWCWPDNIHKLYNRASCDENGNPINPDNKLVWWDPVKQEWDGYDVPDVGNRKTAPGTPGGNSPFRMNGEGIGRLFAATYYDLNADGTTRDHSYTPVDGPLPEFYEPVESPVKNILHEGNANAQFNPVVVYPRMPEIQKIGTADEYPIVLSTSSLAEHWCGGTITRNVTWLNEMVKEPFIEMSHSLAERLKVKSGDKVTVSSIRGSVTVKAMVTHRMQPLNCADKNIDIVWMPYNWGFTGLSKGPSTNYLTIDALDPNVNEQEFKACLVNVKKA